MLTALFGIEDGSLNLAVNLLILVLVIVWLALVYWTWADARRRIEDPVLVATATAASLIPFIGSVIYSILRPPEFLEDARERELETRAAELRLRQLASKSCPRCEHPIEASWLRCPECQQRLKDPCRSCGRPVDPRWSICPHCESPVAEARSRAPRQAAGTQRRTRPAPAADGREQRPARSERSDGERRPAAQQKRRASGSTPAPAPAPRAKQSAPKRRAQPTQAARPDADPPTTTN